MEQQLEGLGQWVMFALGVVLGIAATAIVSANRRGDRCGECLAVARCLAGVVRPGAGVPVPLAWDDLERLHGSEGPDLPGRGMAAEVDGMMGTERGEAA
jgi:hypothetical protein